MCLHKVREEVGLRDDGGGVREMERAREMKGCRGETVRD